MHFGSSAGTDHILNPLVSRPAHFLEAPLPGAVAQATQSIPSQFQTRQDLLIVPADIRSAHARTPPSEKLRPPSTGSLDLAQTTARGRAGLNEVPASRATYMGLPAWPSPQSTSKYRPITGSFGPHASLECRLTLPHGTRGHKRPRFEDKLKEVTVKRAFKTDAHFPHA